jgi:hypothetical protein
VDRVIGRLYTAFILRDATFVISGGIVLTTAVHQPLQALALVLGGRSSLSWFVVVTFLGLSYVLGVLLQEGARWPLDKASHRYIKWRSGKDPSKERSIVRMERLHQANTSEHTIHAIERLVFLRQVSATVLSAVFAVTGVLLVGSAQGLRAWQAWLALVLGAILCVGTYLDKSRQLEDVFNQLLPASPATTQ